MLRIKSASDLGAVLRQTRTVQQIRAEDLAAILAISPTTLRRLEQGAPPTAAIATLFNLLDELGIELHLSPPSGIGTVPLPAAQQPPVRTRVKT
jgi:transcriptional regulator with XRE-family HTH domain